MASTSLADRDIRVILVTGSNDGIGYELVRLLATRGHTVYLSSRDEQKGRAAQAALEKEYKLTVKYVRIDVTDYESVTAAKDVIEKEEGKLDALVNNAGAYFQSPATNADISIWQNCFQTNFFGAINLNNMLLPLLQVEQKGPRLFPATIVNVSSGLASNTNQSNPDVRIPGSSFSAYASSKAALNAYTIALARELEIEVEGNKRRVLVNAVTPGLTGTKMLKGTNLVTERTAEDGAKVIVPWVLSEQQGEVTGVFYGPLGEYPW